jgi:DNA-binding transcriptional LysR family regulator
MNIMHLKYAVEVAREGSINRAAETLLMGQPNLSRAIKELEASLGITIFERSAKGMVPTPDGEDFLEYARQILSQIDHVEAIYKAGAPKKQKFSISVPRASYISEAFARFTLGITADPAEICYKETGSMQAVENILRGDYKLGILRYDARYDKLFKEMFEEKNLSYELVAEFAPRLLVSRKSPLSQLDEIRSCDLTDYIEIAHADHYVPGLSPSEVRKTEITGDADRRIFVRERAVQLELLSENPQTFMWASPVPDKLLSRFELALVPCADNAREYKDVLIYHENYRFTELDKRFITELCRSRRSYI